MFLSSVKAELILRWLGGLPGPSANYFQPVSNQKMVWKPWTTTRETLENQWKCQKMLGKPRPSSQKMVCRTFVQTILKMSSGEGQFAAMPSYCSCHQYTTFHSNVERLGRFGPLKSAPALMPSFGSCYQWRCICSTAIILFLPSVDRLGRTSPLKSALALMPSLCSCRQWRQSSS